MGLHQHPRQPNPEGARRRLLIALGLTFSIMLMEAAGGLRSGSLALLADAGHMLFDLLALGIAYLAVVYGERPPDAKRTFGYRRLEVVGALINSVTLVFMALAIGVEAFSRWLAPKPIAVGTMMGVALLGLAANLLAMAALHGGGTEIGLRGAFLHVLGDTLSSVGVLVGAGLIWLTGASGIDPVLSVFIAVVIAITSVRLLKETVDILLESVPQELDYHVIAGALRAVPGIENIHDLHIWSLTRHTPALSAHLLLDSPELSVDTVRLRATEMLRTRFEITQTTLQIEITQETPCALREARAGT